MKKGDLALMRNIGSSKVHVVRLYEQPYPDEKTSPGGYEGRSYLWAGTPLCHINERYYHARYYWHAVQRSGLDESEKCKRCFSRWRGMDRPDVVGLDYAREVPADRPLPTAWREVPPTPLVKDSKPDEDEKAVKELRRWVRGSRYVRLVEVVGDETNPRGVNTGIVGDDEETDHWSYRSSEADCLQKAWEIMAAGGGPF